MLPFRRGLTALACALLLVAPAHAQTTPPPSTSGPDTASLRAIEPQVEQIRGLSRSAEPALRLLGHDALHTYLADQLQRSDPPSQRERAQKELVALGLLGPDDDLGQLQLSLLSGEIDSVYTPETGAVLVLAGQGPPGPAQRLSYATSFETARADQHVDLRTVATTHADNADQSVAVEAFVLGEAQLVQMLWAQAHLSPAERDLAHRTAAGTPDVLANAPLVLRTELLFPYNEAVSFARRLYQQAGNRFTAIDAAFQRPPESTAHVLHPDQYLNQVHPVPVQLPDLAAGLGPDWHQVGSDVLGELLTRALLEQGGADAGQASRVAAGWRGDRWQLIEQDGGGSAMVVRWTWATPAAAADFFAAYANGLANRFQSATIEESSATRQALTAPAVATDLRLSGSAVLAIIASDRATADALAGAIDPGSS
jgi:hypothetical protein